MTTTEKIKAIQKILFSAEVPPVAPVEPKEEVTGYPTKDGANLLKTTSLEVGSVVTINDIAATDGVYILEDGTEVTTENGLIKEVKPATPVAPAATIDEAMKTEVAKLSAQLNDLSVKYAALEERQTKVLDATKETVALMEHFSSQPVVAPVEPTKSFEQMTALERFRATK